MTRPFAPVDLDAKLRACASGRERVRVTMAAFGGYWRPLAAVARLLEELGELSEELRLLGGEHEPAAAEPGRPIGDRPPAAEPTAKLGAELADLWIITTALADQFLGEVAEPGSRSGQQHARPPMEAALALLAAAGPIARIVNYYDGPKTPRSLNCWISLDKAVARFHDALADVSLAWDMDLYAAVQAKLEAIPRLDSGRFSTTWHDPATAPCLDDFRRLPSVANGPLSTARLWGGPDWRPGSIAANLETIIPSLASFARAAPIERLDAFVIPGPPLPSAAAREKWLGDLCAEISAHEPSESVHPSRRDLDGAVRSALDGVWLDARLICAEHCDSAASRCFASIAIA